MFAVSLRLLGLLVECIPYASSRVGLLTKMRYMYCATWILSYTMVLLDFSLSCMHHGSSILYLEGNPLPHAPIIIRPLSPRHQAAS
jgi:hypothetical protein